MSSTIITSVEQLESLYGTPSKASLLKEIDHISDHYRSFIEHSPFVVMASSGPEGLDCSPRGDPPGFVRVENEKAVLLPDRRGNNRLDSLKNLVREPRVSLLFLIPGIGETLRINGSAELDTDSALCASFELNGKTPKCIIRVVVDRVYFQCQKAFVRSRLWDPEAQVGRGVLPTTGSMLQALSNNEIDGEAYDRNYPGRLKSTIY